MSFGARIGAKLTTLAGRYGIKKLFTASLDLKDVKIKPIRRPEDDIGEIPAMVFRMEVENVGSKPAKNCRPYIYLDGVSETDEGEMLVEITPDSEKEFEIEKLEYNLDTQVFWSDDVDISDHFDEGANVNAIPEKTITPGETASLTFAMVIAGQTEDDDPRIRFPGKEGFNSSSKPDIKVDGQPYSPPNVGNASKLITAELPVKELKGYFWNDAYIYVTSESTGREEAKIYFVFEDDEFTIERG